jgi:hypothetical protein
VKETLRHPVSFVVNGDAAAAEFGGDSGDIVVTGLIVIDNTAGGDVPDLDPETVYAATAVYLQDSASGLGGTHGNIVPPLSMPAALGIRSTLPKKIDAETVQRASENR